ncbi:hypothetical protein FXO38_36602, partial [Capsicum annuum]
GYPIGFVTIIWHKIHGRAFGKTMNLGFPYLIQRSCDEVGVPDILGEDEIEHATATVRMNSIKDLACPGLPRRSSEPGVVPRANTKGLSVSTEPGDIHSDDVGANVDIEIGEQRKAPNLSTRVRGHQPLLRQPRLEP